MVKKIKLTKRNVDSLKTTGREYATHDTLIPGFHVRVSAAGEKTYAFRYKRRGSTRRLKIGDCTVMTADEARAIAAECRVRINNGADPAKERLAERQAETMEELWQHYLDRHAIPKKRARSVAEDRRLWRLHLAPAFGRERVKDVRKVDVERFMASKSAKKGAANRAFALLSKMMNLAVGWELIDRSPCYGVEKYHEARREVTELTDAERRRLLEALAVEEEEGDAGGAMAIELLLFTGARLSEVLTATWDQFRGDSKDGMVWLLPATNTKRKKVNRKPLSTQTAKRLEALRKAHPAIGPAFVFPSPNDGLSQRYDLKGVWRRIRRRANLGHVRLHDLRHDWISAAVVQGIPLEIAGRYAGHSNVATTQRYAHLADDVMRNAAEQRASGLEAARHWKPGVIVPLEGANQE